VARIAEEDFEPALKLYEGVFDRFAYAFLRDLKIARPTGMGTGQP
jgi:hypothetical protein